MMPLVTDDELLQLTLQAAMKELMRPGMLMRLLDRTQATSVLPPGTPASFRKWLTDFGRVSFADHQAGHLFPPLSRYLRSA
jgi:hypothetical protein